MNKRKKIEYLEEKVDGLLKDLDAEIEHRRNLEKELAKMTRILKHHDKFAPVSCELSWTYLWFRGRNDTPKLYMYIYDEEYILELPELDGKPIDKDTITFELDSDDERFVIFTIQNSSQDKLYKFTIDYSKDKYLYSSTKIEQKEMSEQ